jgi:predicted nucleic acid-binding protein
MIVQAAEIAGCEVLYSEDLSHGQQIRRRASGEPVLALSLGGN